jgi:hypothetical protein
MARNNTVLCSCCNTLVSQRTERRHRNLENRPRVNVALAAARRNLVASSGISRRSSPSPRNKELIQSDSASEGTGTFPQNPPTDPGNDNFNESPPGGDQGFDIVAEGYGDIGKVADARCMWRAPRVEDSESEDEDGSADEVDDEIGENQDEEEDEFLPSLSAWNALGHNFEQELADIGKRAFVNCISFS